MKYAIIFTVLILSMIWAKENTTLIKIDGMVCSYSCSGKVTNIVQKMDGIKNCSVDFNKGVATVVYDDKKVDEKDILDDLMTKTSYKASLLEENKSTKKVDKI